MAAERFNIVITDVRMAAMDGLEVLARVKQLNPKAKVIIISGYLLSGQIEEAMTLGAKAFLTKPFSFEELRTTVRNVLEQNLN